MADITISFSRQHQDRGGGLPVSATYRLHHSSMQSVQLGIYRADGERRAELSSDNASADSRDPWEERPKSQQDYQYDFTDIKQHKLRPEEERWNPRSLGVPWEGFEQVTESTQIARIEEHGRDDWAAKWLKHRGVKLHSIPSESVRSAITERKSFESKDTRQHRCEGVRNGCKWTQRIHSKVAIRWNVPTLSWS